MASTTTGTQAADLTEIFERSMNDADRSREQQLANVQATQESRRDALAVEVSRLTIKYGKGSAQAAVAQTRHDVLAAALAGTKAALQRAKTKTVTAGAGEAIYYGTVTDQTGAPAIGFTVEVVSELAHESLGTAETDSCGRYLIELGSVKERDPKEGAAETPPQVTLAVVKGKRVYLRDDQKLPLEAGRAVYRDLVLPGADECDPPAQPAGDGSKPAGPAGHASKPKAK